MDLAISLGLVVSVRGDCTDGVPKNLRSEVKKNTHTKTLRWCRCPTFTSRSVLTRPLRICISDDSFIHSFIHSFTHSVSQSVSHFAPRHSLTRWFCFGLACVDRYRTAATTKHVDTLIRVGRTNQNSNQIQSKAKKKPGSKLNSNLMPEFISVGTE